MSSSLLCCKIGSESLEKPVVPVLDHLWRRLHHPGQDQADQADDGEEDEEHAEQDEDVPVEEGERDVARCRRCVVRRRGALAVQRDPHLGSELHGIGNQS